MNLIYNDIAIVYDEKPYVLAVTTSNLGYEHSQKVIAEIAAVTHQLHKQKYKSHLSITTQVNRINAKDNQSFDQTAIIVKDRILVPMRETLEAVGANVQWDPKNKAATIAKNGYKIVIPMHSKQVKINNKTINTEVEAQLINGSTHIQLRLISEGLGCQVVWHQQTKTVEINE